MGDFPHGDERPEPTGEIPPPAASEPLTQGPRPGLISSSSAPGSTRASEVWAESTANADAPTKPVEQPHAPIPSIELTAVEARVLGAMIEKSFLTPDVYPMTTNALVTACNQKTNRDPVVDYSAVDIDSTLLELRQRNLVRRVHTSGSRSTKHRQTLDEALSLSDGQLALLSVLLLRGAQTIPELRLRTDRHDVGFDDLDAVQRCLDGLRTRANPLVRELPRQSGQRENRWQHLVADPAAADTDAHGDAPAPAPASPATVSPAPVPAPAPASPAPASLAPASLAPASPAPASLAPEDELADRVEQLETQVATLRRQLASLAEKLGEPLE